mmetsp:Transcript_9426/g.32807  ORF Transcript_9426/g.32807 Transcript_9426/m.32807 type:complete len:269 (+) Transcript_9426:2828-3634(+)
MSVGPLLSQRGLCLALFSRPPQPKCLSCFARCNHSIWDPYRFRTRSRHDHLDCEICAEHSSGCGEDNPRGDHLGGPTLAHQSDSAVSPYWGTPGAAVYNGFPVVCTLQRERQQGRLKKYLAPTVATPCPHHKSHLQQREKRPLLLYVLPHLQGIRVDGGVCLGFRRSHLYGALFRCHIAVVHLMMQNLDRSHLPRAPGAIHGANPVVCPPALELRRPEEPAEKVHVAAVDERMCKYATIPARVVWSNNPKERGHQPLQRRHQQRCPRC